jgi:outer membrane biosynthesis protein TonB
MWYHLKTDKDRFSTLVQGTGAYVLDLWLGFQFNLRNKPEYGFDENGVKLLASFHDEQVVEFKEVFKDKVEVVEDDDEDSEPVVEVKKPATPKKATPKKAASRKPAKKVQVSEDERTTMTMTMTTTMTKSQQRARSHLPQSLSQAPSQRSLRTMTTMTTSISMTTSNH